MSKLTERQIDAMRSLSNYVGETVDVMTSHYTNGVNPDFVASSKGVFSSSTLRGLEKKGFIRIENSYWRGATITVLK